MNIVTNDKYCIFVYYNKIIFMIFMFSEVKILDKPMIILKDLIITMVIGL